VSQHLLEGEYVEATEPDPRVRSLEIENADLRRKLQRAELEVRHSKEGIEQTLAEIKRLTLPFLNLLRAIHGEIDALGITAASGHAPAVDAPKNKAWDLWKQKLPGFPSRMIDALLEHGELSVGQLVVAAQCPRKQTIYDAASKLQKLGLLNSNNGKYSLKEL